MKCRVLDSFLYVETFVSPLAWLSRDQEPV